MKYLLRGLALAGALVGAAACSADRLQIPNYNAPTVEGVAKDPQGVQIGVTGMLERERSITTDRTRPSGIFGRELYYYFNTDARWVSNPLIGIGTPQKLDQGGFVGAQNWFEPYRQARTAKNLMAAAAASTLTDAEKKGVNGFAKTLKALGYSRVIEAHDSLGMPVDINDDPNDQPEFVSRDSAYKYISGLLDEAKADLAGAGATFPFVLTSGFAGFNTPANFLKVNRAIAARILIERAPARVGCGTACYTAAIAALNESFISTPASLADLNVGVYNVYSTTSGDVTNPLGFAADGSLFAHASYVTDAQTNGGTPDARVTRKLDKLVAPITAPQGLGIPATYRFKVYATNTTPVPIIRNEELVLLRAEARWFTGDKAGAIADLNTIRSVSGGLGATSATAGSTDAVFIQALLYERRYSLMLEGLRWIDYRRFGLLQTLPKDLPTHFVAIVQPIPQAECDARKGIGGTAPGCT
jgi:hypothetical protein